MHFLLILSLIFVINSGYYPIYAQNQTETPSADTFTEPSWLKKWLYPVTAFTETAGKMLSVAQEKQDISTREQAITILEEVMAKKPDDPIVAYNLANGYQLDSKFSKAAEVYQLALKNLGFPQSEEEDANLLAANIRNAELDKKELAAKFFFNQGNNYFKQENFLEAVQSYKYSLIANPNDLSVKRNFELALQKLAENSSADAKKDSKPQNQNQADEKDKNKEQGNPGEQPNQNQEKGNEVDSTEAKKQPDSQDTTSGNPKPPPNQTTRPENSKANSSDTSSSVDTISLERAEQILNSYQNQQKKLETYRKYPQRISPNPNHKNW